MFHGLQDYGDLNLFAGFNTARVWPHAVLLRRSGFDLECHRVGIRVPDLEDFRDLGSKGSVKTELLGIDFDGHGGIASEREKGDALIEIMEKRGESELE